MTYFSIKVNGEHRTFSTMRKLGRWEKKNPGNEVPLVTEHVISEETVRELRKIANKRKKPARLTIKQVLAMVRRAGIHTLTPDENGNITLRIT